MTFRQRLAILALGTATAACAVLRPAETITLYAPAPVVMDRARAEHAQPVPLRIEQPRAIAPFDGTRMVVFVVPGEIQFYKNVRWQDAVPRMLQDQLLQAFRQTETFAGASTTGGARRTDCVLYTDIEAFQAEYRGAALPTVVIRLSAQLQRNASPQAAAARRFSVERRSAGTAPGDVFAAFQDALHEVLEQVVAWSDDTVAQPH